MSEWVENVSLGRTYQILDQILFAQLDLYGNCEFGSNAKTIYSRIWTECEIIQASIATEFIRKRIFF